MKVYIDLKEAGLNEKEIESYMNYLRKTQGPPLRVNENPYINTLDLLSGVAKLKAHIEAIKGSK
tara:strand:- start:8 stop:199 length:192 start_codon:yes stop_codon:yes gene_type:complete